MAKCVSGYEYRKICEHIINMDLVGVEEGVMRLSRMERRILHVPAKCTRAQMEVAVDKLCTKMGKEQKYGSQKKVQEKREEKSIGEQLAEYTESWLVSEWESMGLMMGIDMESEWPIDFNEFAVYANSDDAFFNHFMEDDIPKL